MEVSNDSSRKLSKLLVGIADKNSRPLAWSSTESQRVRDVLFTTLLTLNSTHDAHFVNLSDEWPKKNPSALRRGSRVEKKRRVRMPQIADVELDICSLDCLLADLQRERPYGPIGLKFSD